MSRIQLKVRIKIKTNIKLVSSKFLCNKTIKKCVINQYIIIFKSRAYFLNIIIEGIN